MIVSINSHSAFVKKSGVITTGSIGYKIYLEFSDDWKNLSKTCVFSGSDTVKDVLISGHSVVIPWECLTKTGELTMGVYGVGTDVTIPTIYCSLGNVRAGTDPSGDESTTPTLPVYSQLQAVVNSVREDMDNFSVPDADIDESVERYQAEHPVNAYTKEQTDTLLTGLNGTLTAKINTNTANISANASAIAGERNNRIAKDMELETAVTNINSSITAVQSTITALQQSLNSLTTRVTNVERQLGDLDAVLDALIEEYENANNS